jgi:serine phosphatase RsbU (regulator of sigma subunit)
MTKASFSEDGLICWINPEGEHELPVDTMLPHRFTLVDGKIVDKYNGMTDQEVKEKDHEDAIAAREALIAELEEGAPVPAELPPLDFVAPEVPSAEGDN